MTDVPVWSGTVGLPPLRERRVNIGGNPVIQTAFAGAGVQATLIDTDQPGHRLLRTTLSKPFDEILVRAPGSRRSSGGRLVVTGLADTSTTTSIPRWDDEAAADAYMASPEEVRASWAGRFRFVVEDREAGIDGLRPPQAGALHAISAHFSVGTRFEAATVVLPTGTGKTETMLATLVFRRLPKTLVLVSSDVLRSQIARKFVSLGVLPGLGVVPADMPRPRVAVLTKGVASVDQAGEILSRANVIVTLPQTLEASDPHARALLMAGCSDLVVDEAHHVTARTWANVRSHFDDKRVIQFTATPFRRDGRRIDGKIIFNFKLGDAQAAGYYKPINLVAVEEYGEQALRDRAVAAAALSALRRDRGGHKLDHLLMARVRSKERAEELFALYKEIASEFRPVVVYSGPGRIAANRDALARLLDKGLGGSRIVIAVDMLGEGFDLPNLKVAALHDIHKSLAITLQFVGRFTRTGTNEIGDATAVVNIADSEVERRLAELYAEGADWDRILRRLSEDRVDQELRLQEVVDRLRSCGDLHQEFALWNLRPSFSTQFFRTRCEAWNPLAFRSVLSADAEAWYALDEERAMLAAVVRRPSTIRWGDYQDVVDILHDLVLMRWDKEAGVLCLYASDYSAMRSDKMAELVTDEHSTPVTGTPIFRILNNVELPLAKSLGSSRIGAISFTSYFGPNVTEGLASIEKADAALNNIACLGYESGERVVWGAAQRRGKVWQVRSGSVADWIAWTRSTWTKVETETGDESNLVRDFLRPIKLDRPYGSVPIAVQWGEQAQLRYNDRQFLVFDGTEVGLYLVDLDVGEPDSDGSIPIHLISGQMEAQYRLEIDGELPGGYAHRHISGSVVRFRKGSDETVPLEEYLKRDPLIVRYADGTYSYNCYHIPIRLDAGRYDPNRLEVWDWSGIELNRESMHQRRDVGTIQYRTFEHLNADYDLIFNDDGSGEAADLVCLKDVDEATLRLCFVHCKGAHGGKVSRDIRNLYTVCGQAQKSIAAKHQGISSLCHDLRRRHEIWAQQGSTRFLKGTLKDLSFFKEKARRAKVVFEMIIVQPGASAQTITGDSLALLATTELYLKKTTDADVRFVVSP